MSAPDYSLETALLSQGCFAVAGVDEVGRGALAGPVVVAAVILNPDCLPAGLDDSKKLSARSREYLFDLILKDARAICVALAPASEVDRVNIRQATLSSMRRAVAGLAIRPDHALIDGRDIPPHLPCPATALIKGDGRSISIAAASIIAKVMRDRLMVRLDAAAPGYGFIRHVGYGTAAHLAGLNQLGGSRFHRLSFAPLKTIRL